MMLLYNYFFVYVYKIAGDALRYSMKHSAGTIESKKKLTGQGRLEPRRVLSKMLHKAMERI